MNAKKIQAAETLKSGPRPDEQPVDRVKEVIEPLTVSVEKAAKLLGISRASAYTGRRASFGAPWHPGC
jgi:hypothetical protein